MVDFSFATSPYGPPKINSVLATLGGVMEERLEPVESQFEIPEGGWVSSLFAGPQVEGQFYCQNLSSHRQLLVTYYPKSDLKVFLAYSPSFSNRELSAHPVEGAGTALTLQPSSALENKYQAGSNTVNPYWLQVSIPINRFLGANSTVIFFQFL